MTRIRLSIFPILAAAACAPQFVAAPVPASQPQRLASTTTLLAAPPAAVGMDAALPATLDSLANAAIADRAASGIAIAVGRWGRIVHLRGYGAVDWAPGSAAVTDSTLFDMASVTKVVATTTASMSF